MYVGLSGATKCQDRAVWLDIIRGLAAFSVLLFHARFMNFDGFDKTSVDDRGVVFYFIYGSSRFGQDGVIIFFVLSGFLIGGRLVRSINDDCFSDRRFFIGRFSRIIPPLTASVAITLIMQSYFGVATSVFQVVGNAVGLNGVLVETMRLNGPLWSIAYEIWFYILGWAGISLIARRFSIFSLVGAILGVLVFSTALDWHYFMFWALGAVSFNIRLGRNSFCIFVFGLMVMLAGLIGHQILLNTGSNIDVEYLSIEALGFALALPYLAGVHSGVLLSAISPTAAFMAAISYSLYLTHVPINVLLSWSLGRKLPYGQYSVALYSLRIAVCVIFAWGFSVLFERKMRDASAKWAGAVLSAFSLPFVSREKA